MEHLRPKKTITIINVNVANTAINRYWQSGFKK
jgi:hypothetical protein